MRMKVYKISDEIEAKKSSIIPQTGVFAKEDIRKWEVLVDIEANVVKRRVDYALQTGESSFLLASYIDNYINHSCDPNVRVKLYRGNEARVTFVALKDVKRGNELFWNFDTTEWDFGRGFVCKCGSRHCVGRVRGMKYLTDEQRKRITRIATPFIRMKVKETEAASH